MLIACMRKLLIAIYSVARNRRPFVSCAASRADKLSTSSVASMERALLRRRKIDYRSVRKKPARSKIEFVPHRRHNRPILGGRRVMETVPVP